MGENRNSVREANCAGLLPSLAMWATHRGCLHSHLFSELLKTVETVASEKVADMFAITFCFLNLFISAFEHNLVFFK